MDEERQAEQLLEPRRQVEVVKIEDLREGDVLDTQSGGRRIFRVEHCTPFVVIYSRAVSPSGSLFQAEVRECLHRGTLMRRRIYD